MSSLLNGLIDLLARLFPRAMNRVKIDFVVSRERRCRPHPFSLWTGLAVPPPPDPRIAPAPAAPEFAPSGYVSWPGLSDRSYAGRHLPPADEPPAGLPDPDTVVATLFLRDGPMIGSKSSSALFCFFAQWFTDSFLRTHPLDRRRHTGNHEIDFCQIYGLDEQTTMVLRARQGGLMLMRGEAGAERMPFLVIRDAGDAFARDEVDPRFRALSYLLRPDNTPEIPFGATYRSRIRQSLGEAVDDTDRWRAMYATGLDRGNSTIFYTALSTMCLREHNRIARALAAAHPQWDDDRLFETARLINIHNVLEIVIEDYINHIAGGQSFALDSGFAERRPWYRTNRISLEFNLLYRWHSLVPDTVEVEGATLDHLAYRFNNLLVEGASPERLINSASRCPAGRVGLYNTPAFLARAEASSIHMGRQFRLQSFNAYRERFRQPRYGSIEELVGGDARAAADLNRLYGGDIDRVDFIVGLFAEGRSKNDPDATLPPLLRTMVAVDAFTHIFTNPVLSAQVREAAFAPDLMPYITDTGGIAGLIKRNCAPGERVEPSFAVRE